MLRKGLRASFLLILCTTLLVPVFAHAAEIDWNAYKWDAEYADGIPFEEGMVLPGQLVVRFEQGATPNLMRPRADGIVVTGRADLDLAAERTGTTTLVRVFPELPVRMRGDASPDRDLFYVVNFDPTVTSVRGAAEAWSQVDGIATVEPSPVHRMHAVLPDDPSFDQQWWLRTPDYGFEDISAVAAWYHTTGSSNVIVCVADSGVDWKHPDLGGTAPNYTDGVIWINWAEMNGNPGVDDDSNGHIDDFRGWDYVHGVSGINTPPQDLNTPDNNPMDYSGHGTAVAGCISALSNNGYGIASTNWSAKIMPVDIGWTDGSGNGLIGLLFATQALDYARVNGATIFNASWGSSNYSPFVSALNSFLSGGTRILVVSAGNDNNEVAEYLNARSDCVSVAATSNTDNKSGFSSYGVWVDISAPGESIYTTSYNIALAGSGGAEHTFTTIQGTSFSSPIVAGAFAMARAVWPAEGRSALTARVLAATDNIDGINPSYAGKLGTGRLNLAKLFDNGPYWRVPEQMPTLFDAINTSTSGDTVAVLGGQVFTERISIPGGIEATIIGGFDPTYTTFDPVGNPAIIQPSTPSGSVLTLRSGVTSNFSMNGFEIRGGRAPFTSLSPVDGYYGGGVSIKDADPILRNLLITGNIAGQSTDYGAGGGLSIIGGNPLIEDCVITGNSALRGAGVYVYRGTPTFRNVTVDANTSYPTAFGETSIGGGYYITGSPGAPRAGGVSVVIEGGTISGHAPDTTGGGIHAENSDLDLDGVTIDGNTSGAKGAGVYLDGGSLDILNSVISNNTIGAGSFDSGGGLYATTAPVTIDGSTFSGNHSTFSGGGAAVVTSISLSVTNTFFVDNSSSFFGSGLDIGAGGAPTVTFSGNTVANNTSAGALGGSGIYHGAGDVAYTQNIFAFNGGTVGTNADGVHVVGGTATFSCNDSYGNLSGNYSGVPDPTGTNDNISLDPIFCDAAGGDYGIMSTSPAATAVCGHMGAGGATCVPTAVGELPSTDATRSRFALQQNNPNPFNPKTRIHFSLANEGHALLRVFDVRGRVVTVLVDGNMPAGDHQIDWNGKDRAGQSVASGTYFYELQSDGQRIVRKMGLLK